MCGRYSLHAPEAVLRDTFGVLQWPRYEARYNLSPSAQVPVIRQSPEGERVAHALRWGLLPHWSKDPALGQKLNNARADTLLDRASFRGAYQRRRCIVPMSGFYEWQAIPGARKQPWFIQSGDGQPLGVAGLWESWVEPGSGEVQRSFCVITTEPNRVMQPIHDRMPVILPPGVWSAWLSPATPLSLIEPLLRPADDGLLQAWPVSRRVSSSREEGADLILPAGLDEPPLGFSLPVDVPGDDGAPE
ncbi:MAG: SOS response-associated peptidase [Zoogloea sp.]|uniref:SOS response-associated peptidase n=1 Tax=Zoogloea sp. TaxID=49181 RepID=UPI003F387001